MSNRLKLPLVWALFLPCTVGAGSHPPMAGEQVAIVTTSGVPAYDEVLDGLRRNLKQAVYVIDLRQKDGELALNDALRLKTVRIVATIGSEAAETVTAQQLQAGVIAAATMPYLFSKDSARSHPVSVMPVQLPVTTLLENVKRVFPGKRRLGMLRNPAMPDSGVEALRSAAESAGFTPKIVDCNGPGQLLEALRSFKDQVDLVLCFPDSALYNSATIKPLVLASLRYRLPLIGFSESFARAGAVLAVYPDFRDMGARAADLIHRMLNGQSVPRLEHSRRCRITINQNITRLIGITYTQPPGAGYDFVVIR